MKNAVIFSIVLVATHAVAWVETALFSISLSSKRRAWPIRPALHFLELIIPSFKLLTQIVQERP